MFTLFGAGNGGSRPISIIVSDARTIRFQSFGWGSLDFTIPKLSTGVWYHLALVRDANYKMTVYLNGVRSSTGILQNIPNYTPGPDYTLLNVNTGLSRFIGKNPDGNRFNGYISNLRLVTGTALYDPNQSSITVPTAPLTSVTNTKLLLLANSAATVATDASATQTLSTDGTAPDWAANSPFRETITAARTVSNSVAGGTWSSSNTSIATVNASGVITAVANGDANITYTITSGGCTSTDVTPITVALPCTTNNWIGGTGNCSVAANWSCGTVPDGSTDIAISSGTPTLDLDFTLPSGKTLTLSGTGSLIIAAGKTLTIAGTVNFGGRPVTLQSTSAGDAAIGQVTGTLSNATQVTVERYIGTSKRAWRLLTIPVTSSRSIRDQWGGVAANANAPTGESAGSGTLITGHAKADGAAAVSAGFDWFTGLSATSSSSIRHYTNTGVGSFSSATNTPDILAAPGRPGYMIFIRGDRTVTFGSGTTTLRPMGTLNVGTISTTIATQAYRVMANPYPATIDVNQVYLNSGNSNAIKRNFWIWDANLGTAGAFRAISWGGSSYSMTGGTGTATDFLKVRSGNCFMTERLNGGAFIIEEKDKIDGTTAPVVLGDQQTNSAIHQLSISLFDGKQRMTDGALLRFGEDYSKDATEDYDMAKFNNFNENLSLVRDGRYLSIESRPLPKSADTAFITYWNLPNGEYRLVINPSDLNSTNLNASLRDAYTGTELPFTLNGQISEHKFEINTDTASKSLNRFIIIFKPVAANPTEVTELSAAPRPTGISVSWKVSQPSRLLYSELQGSNDGTTYHALTTITGGMMGADGSYTWLDRNPHAGINHYRVRTLTLDGNSKFSQTATAEWLAGSSVRLSSNPSADGRIRLILTNLPEGRYQLSVRKMNGAKIHQQYLDLSGSIATPEIDLDRSSRALSAGIYLITIDNGKGMKETLKWFYKP